jgi:signal transduction histidine kinase
VLTITPESARLDGIGDDLHRLILNLLENAISHTPPGTQIRARTGVEAGHPVLVVEDDGPGIPTQLQARVFERFVRGGGDAGGSRGTGLGLAIVEAVADAHGASVEMLSLPDLHGTRFTITFPKVMQPVNRPGAAIPTPRGGVRSPAAAAAERPADQTSTTTGSTIGRRRNLS